MLKPPPSNLINASDLFWINNVSVYTAKEYVEKITLFYSPWLLLQCGLFCFYNFI